MNYKKLSLICLTTLIAQTLPTFGAQKTQQQVTTPPKTQEGPEGILLEFRTSYFYPLSSSYRAIFPNGNANYQITGAFPVYDGTNVWVRGLDLWAGVDYYGQNGKSTILKEKTSIWIVPITLGLKYFFPPLGETYPVNFYVASGMKYFFVHTHNHSSYVQQNVNTNGMGGVVESGLTITFIQHLVLDVFGAYSFRTFGGPEINLPNVESTGLNISNINVGLGLGYKF